mmetsp:Transcript_149373/g.271933  ORF Transcript_149373/g.271933 Transcript_149373/m.271933 type:complete len:115 (-) Transcript_149373:87-431(-)
MDRRATRGDRSFGERGRPTIGEAKHGRSCGEMDRRAARGDRSLGEGGLATGGETPLCRASLDRLRDLPGGRLSTTGVSNAACSSDVPASSNLHATFVPEAIWPPAASSAECMAD